MEWINGSITEEEIEKFRKLWKETISKESSRQIIVEEDTKSYPHKSSYHKTGIIAGHIHHFSQWGLVPENEPGCVALGSVCHQPAVGLDNAEKYDGCQRERDEMMREEKEPFKTGDTVVCIKPFTAEKPQYHICIGELLTVGHVYPRNNDEDALFLAEKNAYYLSNRFKRFNQFKRQYVKSRMLRPVEER